MQGTTGQTEFVLGVKSFLQNPFSPAMQELGARGAVTYMYPKAPSFSCPISQGSFPPWGHQPHSNFRDFQGRGVLPKGRQGLIVWPIRIMATDSGTNQARDGHPLLILFGKDALCSARVAKAVKWKPAATDGSPLRESLPLRKTITEENRARE